MDKTERPSVEYIEYICNLYGDIYDDRVEDSRPPAAGDELRTAGEDWQPGQEAAHKSLIAFQRELKFKGIELSSSKIRKILISGGCWSTERSREIISLFDHYTTDKAGGGEGLTPDIAVKSIAADLKVSVATVSMNLPYQNVVYKLENKSRNAVRCARYKKRKRKNEIIAKEKENDVRK